MVLVLLAAAPADARYPYPINDKAPPEAHACVREAYRELDEREATFAERAKTEFFSIDLALDRRRSDEQFCRKVADCIISGLTMGDKDAAYARGSQFEICLERVTLDRYDAKRR
jgi:hypothetical protein